MSDHQHIALGEVVTLNPTLKPSSLSLTDTLDFFPMSVVSAECSIAKAVETRAYVEVRNGYTSFSDGDVLLAKITPCFENGKIAQAQVRSACAFGSTEFHVLRPNPEKLDGRYLVHFLRRDEVRIEGERKMTGSGGQRRVPKHFLQSLQIRLPHVEEQRRIAAILDKADALRMKRREALACTDRFATSIFLWMFGDASVNAKAWPTCAMSELFESPPTYGTMIPPSTDQADWLSLRVANIQNWKLDISDQKFVQLPLSAVVRHTVQDGDMLLARAIASQDHLGKAIVVNPEGRKWAFDSHLMRLRFDKSKAHPEFVRQLLESPGGRSLFLRVARRSAVQFNINTKEMSALRIPCPPIEMQTDFAVKTRHLAAMRATQQAALNALNILFSSLQHRAFNGDL